MAKKNEPIIYWETTSYWNWREFTIGCTCDAKSKFYTLDLGFFHILRYCLKKFPVETPKRKKK